MTRKKRNLHRKKYYGVLTSEEKQLYRISPLHYLNVRHSELRRQQWFYETWETVQDRPVEYGRVLCIHRVAKKKARGKWGRAFDFLEAMKK